MWSRAEGGRVAGSAVAMGVVAAVALASPSYAADVCPPDEIWLSSWDDVAGTGSLDRLLVDAATGALTPADSFVVDEAYGDIALSADGATVLGVTFTLLDAELVELDVVTGGVTRRIAIDPSLTSLAPALNSLSGAADGTLYTGSNATTQLYVIDPADGSWSQPLPSELPTLSDGTPLYAAGDFLTLPDGDVLAVATNTTLPDGPWTFLVRLDTEDGSSQVVGRIAKEIFGAAQSAGWIYLASSDGNVYALEDVPATGTDADDVTAALSTAWEGGTTSWWGAASVEDGGACVADPDDEGESPQPPEESTGPEEPERDDPPAVPEEAGPPPAQPVDADGDDPSEPELAATGASGTTPLGSLAAALCVGGILLLVARHRMTAE